tara:strand:+ start:1316 stop:1795 length:480 start_codon:yes stop_codon:yes gene_type:complete
METLTKKKTGRVTVSKVYTRLSRNGWISYNCELRQGKTCLAAVDQEGNGGCERVDWNNTDHYLLLHHYILNTQKDFWRKYELEALQMMVEEGWKDEIKEKIELRRKFLLWEKLALKKPKTWSEARKIQEKLGFFDDMVGAWTTVYVEQKYGHIYYKEEN